MAMKPISRAQKNQGMNWIRPVKRLAIYIRDGMACCYCGLGVEDGVKLTLDHLRPYSSGGSNVETNLVTCCHICNSSRGKRSWKTFAAKAAEYANHGRTAAGVICYIMATRRRALSLLEAAALMGRRGGFVMACQPENN